MHGANMKTAVINFNIRVSFMNKNGGLNKFFSFDTKTS